MENILKNKFKLREKKIQKLIELKPYFIAKTYEKTKKFMKYLNIDLDYKYLLTQNTFIVNESVEKEEIIKDLTNLKEIKFLIRKVLDVLRNQIKIYYNREFNKLIVDALNSMYNILLELNIGTYNGIETDNVILKVWNSSNNNYFDHEYALKRIVSFLIDDEWEGKFKDGNFNEIMFEVLEK